jgi:hypothetical protein
MPSLVAKHKREHIRFGRVSCMVLWNSVACSRVVESESDGNLGGVGIGKNVPTPTSI